MPYENEKRGQNQKQGTSRDGQQGIPTRHPAPGRDDYEDEPNRGKEAGTGTESTQPRRDRDAGDTNNPKQ